MYIYVYAVNTYIYMLYIPILCIYLYVVYICTYIYTLQIYLHAIYTYIDTCMYIYACIYMLIYICMRICICLYFYECIYILGCIKRPKVFKYPCTHFKKFPFGPKWYNIKYSLLTLTFRGSSSHLKNSHLPIIDYKLLLISSTVFHV